MSRVVLAMMQLLLVTTASQAQPSKNFDAATYVKTKSEQLMDIGQNEPKCPEPDPDGEIVVCAEVDNGEDQLIFENEPPDPTRIRRGEAVSGTKAASCIGAYPQCAHRLHKIVGTGFGRVPPPAIPLEEVYAGLPEPDMVVQEGSGDAVVAPPRPE
jgi:hypothetical protein